METRLNILKPFFEEPNREFHIREIARLTNINHTTVRQYLNKFVKEGILELEKGKIYSSYKLLESEKVSNLKLYCNMEKIRKSNIIQDLEKYYDYPVIVLYGSYSKAKDDVTSDIDICVITDINKEFNVSKYEKTLNKEINLKVFSQSSLVKLKKTNPSLINNIANGIVLSGELEVL
ncbi:MAG: nucleotidyltransferase domain-containing protein [archaeon]